MGNFFKTIIGYGGVKAEQAQDAAVGVLVKLDTDAAIEAEERRLDSELKETRTEYAKAATELDKESKEAEAAKADYNKFLAAADVLKKQLEDATAAGDSSKAGALEASLTKLVSAVKTKRPDVEREIREADQAKQYLDQVKEMLESQQQAFDNYRSEVEAARRDRQSALAQEKLEERRADQAEKLAGIRNRSSTLNMVLTQINKQTDEAKIQAEQHKLTVEAAKPKAPATAEDPLIAAAMAEATGTKKPVNISEELDSLKL